MLTQVQRSAISMKSLVSFFVLFFYAAAIIAQPAAVLPRYDIEAASPPRLFAYTNKQNAFYCGVVNGTNDNGFHGITRSKIKIFESYWIMLGNQLLDPRDASIEITPAGFVRRYALYDTEEHVFFADSLTLLSVSVRTGYRGDVKIFPGWSSRWQRGVQSHVRGMFIMRDDFLQGGVSVTGLDGQWEVPPPMDRERLSNPAPMLIPMCYWGTCSGEFQLTVEFAAHGKHLAPRPPQEIAVLQSRKTNRLNAYLSSLGFTCSDHTTTEAFHWIAASMDALVMNQTGPGIYAGLPWFDDYWGRDTFISFPGALLVTGQYETAREVLRSFLTFLDRDSSSVTYGRIPNRVQPEDIIYNTVDGTPWLIIQLRNYYRYTADAAFITEVYEDIRHTVRGAVSRTDSLGFLTHADADTWMDAVGPDGPWSPRGNRAIDIQALWHGQLLAAANMAEVVGDHISAMRWRMRARELADAVQREFLCKTHQAHALLSPEDQARIGNCTIDHLRSDGSPDYQTRPNFLFALTQGSLFNSIPPTRLELITSWLLSSLAYPWGIASLYQHDENFHPWHQATGFYPKDAAYHNGTVWTWLTGPAVEILTRHGMADSAWVLTQSLQRYAMETGMVGSVPENTDALPRDGKRWPNWSGTFSQAWSNAEYLRNMYQNYLGAFPSFDEQNGFSLRLDPGIPSALNELGAAVAIGSSVVHIAYARDAQGQLHCTVSHRSGPDVIRLETAGSAHATRLKPGDAASIEIATNDKTHGEAFRSVFHFALPRNTRDIAAIQPPAWPLIDGMTATARNPGARILCSSTDPDGDDTGINGSYVYPLSPLFRPGSFDLRRFEVRADDEMLYFEIEMQTLSQPGWHPEYGFQLTTLAIGIDQSHRPAQQKRAIGHQSGYVLPTEQGFDKLLLVGGGVQLQDTAGTILAEFIPRSRSDAFGDVSTGIIAFAIPRTYLTGIPDHWRYTIVSGAQDDHGGAGIGEFRAVRREAGEWHGGGSPEDGPNWYDVMSCP